MGYVSEWEKRELKGIRFTTRNELRKAIKNATTRPQKMKFPKIKIDSINIRPKQSRLNNVINIRKIIKKGMYTRD